MHASRIGLNYKGCIGKCEYFVFLVHICILSSLFMMSIHIISFGGMCSECVVHGFCL